MYNIICINNNIPLSYCFLILFGLLSLAAVRPGGRMANHLFLLPKEKPISGRRISTLNWPISGKRLRGGFQVKIRLSGEKCPVPNSVFELRMSSYFLVVWSVHFFVRRFFPNHTAAFSNTAIRRNTAVGNTAIRRKTLPASSISKS